METVDSNISIQLNKIERLSIVDTIDSLYLFGYDRNNELILNKKEFVHNNNNLDFLSHIGSNSSNVSYKLYYSNPEYEILPRSLFSYGNEKEYLKNIFPDTNNSINFIDRSQEEQKVVIYRINTLKDIKYREILRGLHTYHFVSSILNKSALQVNVLHVYKLGNILYYFKRNKHEWDSIFCKVLSNSYDFITSLKEVVNTISDVSEILLCGDINKELTGFIEIETLKVGFYSEDLHTNINFLKF